MLRLNGAVKNKKRSAAIRSNASKPVDELLCLLQKFKDWVVEIEPVEQKTRFGNAAFRIWHTRVGEHAKDFLSKVIAVGLKENEKAGDCPVIAEELAEYMKTCFGNEQRLDYGSGHEATFLLLLFCLDKVGVLTQQDDVDLVLLVFTAYLEVTRSLQKKYRLEPAGSHGVWGLDDYSFLPFLWGSSQLFGSTRVGPEVINDDPELQANREEYLYLDAIAFIKEVKSGPFFEHSPILSGVSQVKEGWPKINRGMIKMYRGEVWNKKPVIQHFLFGDIFPFAPRSTENADEEMKESNTTSV